MAKRVAVNSQGPGRFVLATELNNAVNQLKISQNTVRADSFKCGDPTCTCLNYVKHKWKPKVTLCVECGHPQEYHTEAPVIPEQKAALVDTGFSEEDEEDKTASLPPVLDLNLFQPLPPQLGAAGLNDMVEVTKFLNATLRNFIAEKRGAGGSADTGNLKIAEQELEIQLLKIALDKERKTSESGKEAQATLAKMTTELEEVAQFAKLESTRAKNAEHELETVTEKLTTLMSSHVALNEKCSALSNTSPHADLENRAKAAEKALEALREAQTHTQAELESVNKRFAELQAAHSSAIASVPAPTASNVEAERENLVQEMATLRQELEAANHRISELASSNANALSDAEQTRQKLAELQLSHAALQTSYLSLSSPPSHDSPPSQHAASPSPQDLIIHSQNNKTPPPPPSKRQSVTSPPPPPRLASLEEEDGEIEPIDSRDSVSMAETSTEASIAEVAKATPGEEDTGVVGEPPVAPPLLVFEQTRARNRRVTHSMAIPEVPPSPKKSDTPLDPAALSEMQKKIHAEFVSTEETYVKGLRLLVHSFVIPLKALAVDATFGLSQDQLSSLCSNLETLLNFHTVFFDALSKPGASAGSTVLTYSDFFKMYVYYLNGYEKILTTLDALRKHKKFQIFLSKVKFDLRKDGGLDLVSYLIMPVQRVPRYVMLLKELLRNTPAEHPEHATLAEALSKVTAVAAQINEAKRHMENITQLLELQNQIVGELPGPLLVVGRVLLRRALVYKRDPTGKRKNQWLFLFNDLVLWTSEGYRYKNQRALVATGMALEVDEKTKEAGVEITTNTECLLFFFPGANTTGTLNGTLKVNQITVTSPIPDEAETAAKEWLAAATTAKEAALQAREDKRKTRAKKLQASTSGVVTEIKTLMTSRLQELNQGKGTPLRQLGGDKGTLERSQTLGKNLTLDHYVKPDKDVTPSSKRGSTSASTTNLHRIAESDLNKEHLSTLVRNASMRKDSEEKTEAKVPREPPPKIAPLLDFVDDLQVYCIRVQIFSATQLRKADAFGLSDPYCEVTIAGAMQRTGVIYNTLNPVWNSTFYFFSLDCPSEIKFELWDEDDSQTLKNDLLGLANISLQAQFNTQESKCALPVNFKGEQKGSVDVAVLCKTCRLRKS